MRGSRSSVANALTPTTTRFAGVDLLLRAIGRFLNRALDESLLDRRERAAGGLDSRRASARAPCSISLVSPSIAYEPASGSTVFGDAAFRGDDLLRS